MVLSCPCECIQSSLYVYVCVRNAFNNVSTNMQNFVNAVINIIHWRPRHVIIYLFSVIANIDIGGGNTTAIDYKALMLKFWKQFENYKTYFCTISYIVH
jgi:hypothetical protein